MTQSIFRSTHVRDYTVFSNKLIAEPSLSFRAKGVLLYLLSKPPDWQTNCTDIQKHGKEGRDAILTALKELKEAGYFKKACIRDASGKVLRWETHVYETPQSKSEGKFTQITENPNSGNPTIRESQIQENPTLLNNDLQSNDFLENTYAYKGNARAASLRSESEPASQLSELPAPSVQKPDCPKNLEQDQFSGPRQKYFSSAQRFAQQFEPLPPWRDSRGANGLNREFCEYIRSEYLATLPCNEGKTPTLADAKQWVSRREFDERIEQVEIRWQAYQECRQGSKPTQSILQQIFRELDRLKLSVELPQSWREIAKVQIVQDLPPDLAQQYLHYLRSQEVAA